MTEYNIKYPIYIPSKGRWESSFTAKSLRSSGIDFKIVIEEQEYKNYAMEFDEKNLLVLPFSNLGSVIPARNFIKEHSIEQGFEKHWQLDDNIRDFYRIYKQKRIRCDGKIAISVCEEFSDRYENIALLGMEYRFFAMQKNVPFQKNIRVYSCSLINNSIPFQWRGQYNEDADLCLQCLSTGYWTTILINAFLVEKCATMIVKGGNTDEIYQGDGRARMARSLERLWPGVVSVNRRFKRPQHVVADGWKKFDNKLIRKKDINWNEIAQKKYEMDLKVLQPIKSKNLQKIVKEHNAKKNKINK